ncbi:hypothetical protein AAG570_011394 [Ranatra chinensis]|uniref:Hemicentin-1 n=1 Tax=Ranatra chinensis TaxID=642074 RepID=A0ABD0YKT1_9HEMI
MASKRQNMFHKNKTQETTKNAAPKILKERSPIIGREANGPIEVVEGLPLSLRCPVTSDSGIPIQIGWFKDGQPLPTTSPMTSARKNNLPELRIAKTARVDSGNYTCRANNSAGQVELNYEVNILVPPKFRDNSNSTLVAEEKHYVLKAGEDLILNCSSEGEPKPIALWLKDKHPLENPPDDNSFQLIDSNQSLVISSTKQMDSGFYTCIINNIAGATERKFNVEDNQTLVTDDSKPVQTSSDGKELYIMYAMERDAGNYTCIAENFAVPLDWTEWSGWDTCSVSCGGGTQSRTRSCGSGTTVKENLENNVKEVGGVKYLEYDTSACQIGDDRQVKSCNVHYCQVAGGWSEWSEWSACSVSCSNNGETGLRSRRRICDNPPPQHGAPPCTGSSDEEEECTVPHCPIHGGWGEWSEWSECSVSCGSGVMTRNRSCDNPTPRYGGSQCRGESRDAALCTKDQCTIMGQWGDWGEWSECSVSCGVGNRIRVRHCSLPIFQEASGCPGDNVEVKTCRNTPCLSRIVESATSNPGLTHASLRVNGRVNGVPLNDRAVTAHFMDNGLRTTVRATAVNHAVGESQDNRAMGYVPFVMPSVAWSTAREKRDATNGLRLTGGKYHQESKFTFSNGQELLVQSDGQGVADSGEFKVDIKMIGEIPTPPTQAVIIISPYEEDVVQTGPNTLYTWANTSIKFDDSEDIPFTWMSTVDYDTDLGSMRFPVEKISTNGIEASYNSSNNVVNYFSSSDVSKKFEDLECPLGFRLMKKYDHCKDIDECKHKRKNKCQSNQICENTIGSYQCLCRHGYKMSPNGKKCIDMMWNDDEDISDDYSAEYPDYRGHGYSGVKFHHTDEIKTSVDGNPFPIEGEPPAAYMLKKDFHEQIGAEEEVWKCKPGYRFTKNFGCKDVNECSDSPPICSAEQICLNTIGSYKCVDSPCPEGFDLHSEPKSCIRWCLGRDDCLEGAKISESFLYAAVSLDRDGDVMSLQVGQPYTDIARLVGFDMKGAPLIGAKTTFEIVQNEAGLPLRTRAEEGGGTGIVYSVDYFVLQKIEKKVWDDRTNIPLMMELAEPGKAGGHSALSSGV